MWYVFLFHAQQGKKKKSSTDLRALAESWGCKVLSLSELVKELRRLKPLPKKDDVTKKNAPATKGKEMEYM